MPPFDGPTAERVSSRYHDPAIAPTVGRPIDVCYEVTATGDRATGGACDQSTDAGQTAGYIRQSELGLQRRGPLRGHQRPEVWYTDAFGRNGQTSPFAGSIRQRLSKMDNKIGVDAGGPVIGNNRNYAGAGVHAPN